MRPIASLFQRTPPLRLFPFSYIQLRYVRGLHFQPPPSIHPRLTLDAPGAKPCIFSGLPFLHDTTARRPARFLRPFSLPGTGTTYRYLRWRMGPCPFLSIFFFPTVQTCVGRLCASEAIRDIGVSGDKGTVRFKIVKIILTKKETGNCIVRYNVLQNWSGYIRYCTTKCHVVDTYQIFSSGAL